MTPWMEVLVSRETEAEVKIRRKNCFHKMKETQRTSNHSTQTASLERTHALSPRSCIPASAACGGLHRGSA